jgi:hypothetical protein
MVFDRSMPRPDPMPVARELPRMLRTSCGLAAAGALVVAGAASASPARGSRQATYLVSRALGGGLPNGPSTDAVISGDRRYARVIAFESDASNLVAADTNGLRDVFAIRRTGRIDNLGSAWHGGRTVLVSRGLGGAPANGASSNVSLSGDFRHRGHCIAFLSAASNLVRGDTNGKVDAFLVRTPGRRPVRVSNPGGRQSLLDTTAVTVSGDCSRVSFVTGGGLYTRRDRHTKLLGVPGASDPSYATGSSDALAFAAPAGVYLSRNGTGRPRLVAPGGSNPVFNDLKRQTLAYQKRVGARTHIAYKDLGGAERIISRRGGRLADADSRNPVIGNSGFYVTFESDAGNLGVDASGRTGDFNARPDAYLFTDVRDLTLAQSVRDRGVPLPGGGQNPSMSYYANYIVFDSPGPLGAIGGAHQIYLRYLGPV